MSLYSTDAPEKDEPRSDTSRIKQVNPDGGDTTDGGDDTPNPCQVKMNFDADAL